MEVDETPMALAKGTHARLLAKYEAIKPMADAGYPEAQAEALNLKALIASTEEISSPKCPAEQVRVFTKALVDKRKSLVLAETALASWRGNLDSLEN